MLDFTTPPEVVRTVVEGERLSLGHLANPTFATELAQIAPLPHQRLAVYKHMLPQARLRFLLADDAGAGKTIMAGLYIRELLSRRVIRRVLIIPPAGLVGNWRRELHNLFSLDFTVVSGTEARNTNPFAGTPGDQVIVSLDTLRGSAAFGRLREATTEPYDLVIFDEAHKLAADRGADFSVRRTDRYRLAEALAGVPELEAGWTLPWRAPHLLLLTATPHMGKDYPYYALWRLLDPWVFTMPKALAEYPSAQRSRYFLRRTKEEMVTLEGRPLYPTRQAETLGYALRQGEVSEQTLYDQTTDYLEHLYNRAKLLNRSAAKLAMSVLQRRLASSTWALLRSFERRLAKLDALIAKVQQGWLSMEQLLLLQRELDTTGDPFEAHTADEESGSEGLEENEQVEDRLLQGVIAESLADLETERARVAELLDLARRVYDQGDDAKFVRLLETVRAERFAGEKFLLFTEHRDTLDFLVQRLEGLGYTGQVAQIHGGMDYRERERQVETFRQPVATGGARLLVCTDAAGEGINLQFCWLMINYDVPWNPARLEQRMGRIHRYGQPHDPVYIFNLVATSTREGRVLSTLLTKLEKIRDELGSDKVYDVIGRVFEEVSIKHYLDRVLEGQDPDRVAAELGGRLTKEQIEALAERERALYGDGGEVARELPALQAAIGQEAYARLLPGYVRRYLEHSAPWLGLRLDGDLDGFFTVRPAPDTLTNPVLAWLDIYPPELHHRLTVRRPPAGEAALWVHPGEPLFEQWRAQVQQKLGTLALRGARFTDPRTDQPYLLHVAVLTVRREADPAWPELARADVLDCRLVGVKQSGNGTYETVPVETLLLLQPATGLPAAAQALALQAGIGLETTRTWLRQQAAQGLAEDWRRRRIVGLRESERFIEQGFAFQEAELAQIRTQLTEKAHASNTGAALELARIKQQQKALAQRRHHALSVLRREPDLIVPGAVEFIAHALVTPPTSDAAHAQFEADVERLAMELVKAVEEAEGARVQFVHTPPLARAASLQDHPGFDVLSQRADGPRRHIEVKGRAALGAVEMTANEYSRACILGDEYWLYVVFQCAAPYPELHRVRNPFAALVAHNQSSVLFSAAHIIQAASSDSPSL